MNALDDGPASAAKDAPLVGADLISVGGQKVYPAEIGEALKEIP